MSSLIPFLKGQYSGKITDIHYLESFTVGTTIYAPEISNSLLHYHENPHISLLLGGGHLEKRTKTEFARLPGDILFCHGGEPHQFITKEFPSKNINLEIDYVFLQHYEISESSICEAITKNVAAKFLILKAYQEVLTNDGYTEASIQMLLLSLIQNSSKTDTGAKPKWAALLSDILQDRWNEQVTLQELAALTQVHPVTISKHFTKYFTCTLGEYMRKLKINKSISLLRNPRLSLIDVALECGFADQSHFIRTFKEITGWLPKHFKKL